MRLITLPLLLANLVCTTHALASEFRTIQTGNSQIVFVYQQMGVPIEGHLNKFVAQFSFDADNLATAKAVFDLDLHSIDAGNQEANDEIGKPAWFNTQAFPLAKFISSEFKALGGNRYEVLGKMTIKGRTQDVSASFNFSPQGNTAAFVGNFKLNRADFAIGEGIWADFGIVANEVQIRFHFLAEAGK